MDGTDWGIVLGFGGIAATVIVSAVTLFLQNRGTEARLRNENRQAHAALGESIRDTAAGLERKFNTRFDAVEMEIAGIKVEIADIKDHQPGPPAVRAIGERCRARRARGMSVGRRRPVVGTARCGAGIQRVLAGIMPATRLSAGAHWRVLRRPNTIIGCAFSSGIPADVPLPTSSETSVAFGTSTFWYWPNWSIR